ncbi:TfoX/Sxy family DNA transformation protein [bacterium]|nr:MAG: TfoX/Sxy family DNA transformation protein [bacterium]QQR62292.1 MAG: TfoX/Sxy family DNA transformation protein [bacterium]QQR63140.1 MAG: TfoX/Sxy family DNA transformation protein [bacterium]
MKSKELLSLKNVGKAVLHDLELLGIHSIEQLKTQNPDDLFEKLQRITGSIQNPCVWDVFAAIIHQANTGNALPWWYFSKLRKRIIG